APADAGGPQGARRPPRAGRVRLPGKALERQGSRGEGLPEDVGREVLTDPFEKGEGRPARPRVRDGDPAGESAGDVVLPRKLPRERRIHARVRVQDLDVVEGDAFRKDSAENFADL